MHQKLKKKRLCFFCQEEHGKLHQATTFKLHFRVLNTARLLNEVEIINKLTERDMMAREAFYHSECLIRFYDKGKEVENSKNRGIDVETQISCTAFVELTNYMLDCAEDDKNKVFKLDDLIKLYEKRISDLGGSVTGRTHSTRFKNKLLSHFENLESKREGKHVYLVFFDDELGSVLKTVFETSLDDDANTLAKAAHILRREIFSDKYEPFQGSFTHDCQTKFLPHFVESFVGMLLHGTNFNKNNEYLEQNKLTVSQLIVQNSIKRTRKDSTSCVFNKSRESPMSTYLGLMVHAKTRKKGLIEELNELGLSIPYRRVLSLTDSLCATVLKEYKEDKVVCPRILKKGEFTTGALDNLDIDPSSSTSKGSFHGTAISLFQRKTDDQESSESRRTSLEKGDKLASLPTSYSEVTPVSYFNPHPETRDYSDVQENSTASEEGSTIAQEGSTIAQEGSKIAQEDSTISQKDSTTAQEDSTTTQEDSRVQTDNPEKRYFNSLSFGTRLTSVSIW